MLLPYFVSSRRLLHIRTRTTTTLPPGCDNITTIAEARNCTTTYCPGSAPKSPWPAAAPWATQTWASRPGLLKEAHTTKRVEPPRSTPPASTPPQTRSPPSTAAPVSAAPPPTRASPGRRTSLPGRRTAARGDDGARGKTTTAAEKEQGKKASRHLLRPDRRPTPPGSTRPTSRSTPPRWRCLPGRRGRRRTTRTRGGSPSRSRCDWRPKRLVVSRCNNAHTCPPWARRSPPCRRRRSDRGCTERAPPRPTRKSSGARSRTASWRWSPMRTATTRRRAAMPGTELHCARASTFPPGWTPSAVGPPLCPDSSRRTRTGAIAAEASSSWATTETGQTIAQTVTHVAS